MKDEIIDILWDFAHSTAKATLNPHITSPEQAKKVYKELANKSAQDIMTAIKKHEPKSTIPKKNSTTMV
jgi:hypothetical protein